MNRKLRPVKSPYQIKNEQVNFLLQDIEKNLEEYRKIIETQDKQLAEIKKILQGAKSCCSASAKENKQLKEYIEKKSNDNINSNNNSINNNIFSKNKAISNQKNIRK